MAGPHAEADGALVDQHRKTVEHTQAQNRSVLALAQSQATLKAAMDAQRAALLKQNEEYDAIGGTLGLVAGIGGRVVNMAIMRVVDVFYAFPSVLLAIAICGVLGAGIGNTILSLTIVFTPPIVRVTESLAAQVKNRDFVEAARASAAPLHAIIRHQILPNVLGGMLVYATSLVGISIILSAGLSFLGLGVTPPNPEWGLMLNALRQAIFVNPIVAALPGFAIVLTSLCFNLLSDGLRSAMDIKLPS